MKTILSLAFLACLTSFNSIPKPEPIAVIELFTSEGCSSCPPADELLAKTINANSGSNKKVYALAFHVDYWNRLGWKDSFSTKEFTARQQNYVSQLHLESAYTPQAIVNGSHEFIGFDARALNDALNSAWGTTPVVSLVLTLQPLSKVEGSSAPTQLHYELQGDLQNCTVCFALVSKHEVTAVKRGENGGHTLNHANVVRQFITADAQKSGDIKFADYPVPAKNNWSVIGFVQRKDGKIVGAGEL